MQRIPACERSGQSKESRNIFTFIEVNSEGEGILQTAIVQLPIREREHIRRIGEEFTLSL